ncbi:MAG: hypothetical protein RBJ76_22775 [Stenomitos frigidus ULC029]
MKGVARSRFDLRLPSVVLTSRFSSLAGLYRLADLGLERYSRFL